jgi:hypothetical protein
MLGDDTPNLSILLLNTSNAVPIALFISNCKVSLTEALPSLNEIFSLSAFVPKIEGSLNFVSPATFSNSSKNKSK